MLHFVLLMALQSPGDRFIIPGWHLQSTSVVGDTLTTWSLPGANVSGWHRVGHRATILAGLLENKVYNETDLFYSDHLNNIDESDFQVPWLYREEFSLPTQTSDQHVFLHVHGITSKADIFLNGAQLATSDFQKGSYNGQIYDLTPHVLTGANALLIQAYPTDYLRDLAIGWADWNPQPPDSGTGVWRAVELTLTGPVTLSRPRVTTAFSSDQKPLAVGVEVETDVTNHGDTPADVMVRGSIQPPNGSPIELSHRVQLPPGSVSTVGLDATLVDPQLWWPAAWGEQPLYKVSLNVSLSSEAISDITPTITFGIRSVESNLNEHNDTQFFVNGRPFQVRGAGYAPDIFLRFNPSRVAIIFQYVLDMGLNTIRLEGKQEHPHLYDIADRMGVMVMAGWECCDKWEGWTYNDDAPGVKWSDEDYPIAKASMLHEAAMMQPHPCLLAFLIGSDFWPDKLASDAYLSALSQMDWTNPIIASASMRGHPDQLQPSGMKMEGPYDWVPPNYWYGYELGAAFGFGSEQGAGVGTPELSSLRRFLSPNELTTLWSDPDAGHYHLSPVGSVFHNRKIFNTALSNRYGQPKGLEDYVFKAQLMDYEATRAEFEAFGVRQNALRPATGVIYWMLNTAWPSLHWQLFDYYLRPAGAYFGAKIGARQEHVALDYTSGNVYLINHSLHGKGARRILADVINLSGEALLHREVTTETTPLASKEALFLPEIFSLNTVAFVRLTLLDGNANLSRNVYWLSQQDMQAATVKATAMVSGPEHTAYIKVTLQNLSDVPAFFIRLVVLDSHGEEVAPVFWSDNYVTLFPHEQLVLEVEARHPDVLMIKIKGGECR
ncbi:glycoside hydrolase superfamily [Aspergillus karnatakaensis]|uniref:putative glycosyl hydrolase n=1 Tax=Aspergillus karnatakaensis TaxID=1810916 RepID=UPI003CCCDCC9